MQEFVYDEFTSIFGSGLIERTASFMDKVVSALNSLFPLSGTGVMNTACAMLSAIAGSLIIIFYFMDMYSQVSRDLLSLDILVKSFIKLLLCFMLVLYCKEITVNLFNVCGNVYGMVKENTIAGTNDATKGVPIKFWGMTTLPDYDKELKRPIKVKYTETTTDYSDLNYGAGEVQQKTETKTAEAKTMRDVFENRSYGLFGANVKGSLKAVSKAMILFIPWLVSYISALLAYLVCISNAIFLIAYAFYMPIALAQCFDDGQRSTGIIYLKKFIAQGLTFAVIIIILWAVQKLQGALLPQLINFGQGAGKTVNINNDNFFKVIKNVPALLSIVVTQFAAVGAMLKASQIARDMIGAR